MLCDGEIAVGLDFCNGVTNVAKTRHFFKKRIVTTTALGTALDDVASRQCAGQGIVVVALPIEFPSCGSNHHGSVGHSGADNDVSTLIQSLFYTPAA